VNKVTLNRGAEVASYGAGPKIVSVLSGKGGVGKSVIAYNLSQRMAALGWPVLLVDADLNWGNIHILANAGNETGLSQFASGLASLKESVISVDEKLDILAASGDPADALESNEAACSDLISKLREQAIDYSCVVLDQSSGRSEVATTLARLSDINLLVMVPELTSISDCYGLYKHLLEQAGYLECRLLLNRVRSIKEGEYVYRKFAGMVEQFIGKPPRCQGYLLEEDMVRRSVAAQTALAHLGGHSTVMQSLTAIGRFLMADRPTQRVSDPTNRERTFNNSMAAADIGE
jgi:flagellar biosynthesis protein FlhG